ncbi:glycosyltransferase [bacterium]|nr:glycosyltransferase [bacterium]
MLLQTTFPPDIRVENEILSLQKHDYDVHLVCKNSGKDEHLDFWNGAIVHRLVKPGLGERLSTILQIPVFLNPAWFLRCFYLVKKYDIQCIHVHDLPLTPVALLLGLLLGVNTIYDMHENYPAALRAWKKTGLEYWYKHPALFKSLERYIVPRFDRLIAVVEENRQRVLKEYELPNMNIYLVSNYVNLSTFVADTPYREIELPESAKIFLYTGGLDVHRGIDITLEAFKLLSKTHDNILLLVVGGGKSVAGKKTETELRRLVETDSLLKDKVIITGWIEIKYIPWLIEKSHYCLIPQAANEHTDTTIPHKIFQYMSFGKPVIAADAKPIQRIIFQSQSGITFKSGDVENYKNALEEILEMNYSEISKQAARKTRELYSWEYAEKELFDLYDSLPCWNRVNQN